MSVCSTVVLKPSRGKLSKADLKKCVNTLEAGGLMVFPTDTVYGLACNAFNLESIAKIYEIKGRDYKKALPIFLSTPEQLDLVAKDVPVEAKKLIDEFWPGPLTLVLRTAPPALHAVRGKSTVAIRIPDHGMVRQILLSVGVPLAVTSANRSGEGSLGTGTAAVKIFRGEIDLIVDGGDCEIGRESTVVDASHFPFTVLRQGALPIEKLAKALNL